VVTELQRRLNQYPDAKKTPITVQLSLNNVLGSDDAIGLNLHFRSQSVPNTDGGPTVSWEEVEGIPKPTLGGYRPGVSSGSGSRDLTRAAVNLMMMKVGGELGADYYEKPHERVNYPQLQLKQIYDTVLTGKSNSLQDTKRRMEEQETNRRKSKSHALLIFGDDCDC